MACFTPTLVKNLMSSVLVSKNNCKLLKNCKSQKVPEKRLHIRLSWSRVKERVKVHQKYLKHGFFRH